MQWKVGEVRKFPIFLIFSPVEISILVHPKYCQTNFSQWYQKKSDKATCISKQKKKKNGKRSSANFHTCTFQLPWFQTFLLPFYNFPSFPLNFPFFLAFLFPFLLFFPLLYSPSLLFPPSFQNFPPNFPRVGNSPT